MKTIILNDKQEMILKDLLVTEIDYLENEAIPDALEIDLPGLNEELCLTKKLLDMLNE